MNVQGWESNRLLRAAQKKVTPLEHLQMRAIRHTLKPGPLDWSMRLLQRTLGQAWITVATRNLHQVHCIERLEPLSPDRSFILVANHRSFFDLYILTAALLRWKLRHRIVFPVRSNFFYDTPQGFLVNGAMSFFAMYPPMFRQRSRASLNVLGLDELADLLHTGGTLVGIHPEGRRNDSDDPYTLLPAHSGVGRLVCSAKVPVVPVFTNGLLRDDVLAQVKGNFDGKGVRIHSVFGEPIDFSNEWAQPKSPKLYQQIADRCLAEVAELGKVEREIRERDTASS